MTGRSVPFISSSSPSLAHRLSLLACLRLELQRIYREAAAEWIITLWPLVLSGAFSPERTRCGERPQGNDSEDGSNWYVYCGNDPVNYVDLWGLESGDSFPSPEAAATDFSNTYWDDSQREKSEFASTIYRQEDGTYTYTYTIPNKGTLRNSDPSKPPKESETIATAHTHVNNNHDSIYISPEDMRKAHSDNVVIYVATDGITRKYDPAKKSEYGKIETDTYNDQTPAWDSAGFVGEPVAVINPNDELDPRFERHPVLGLFGVRNLVNPDVCRKANE